MSAAQRHIHTHISAYLTSKVRQAFPDDFQLIEQQLPALVERYTLKELIIIVRVEIDRLKNSGRSQSLPKNPGPPPFA